MSQNSLALPTSGTLTGLTAVQDINAALDTLNTLASGASAPSSPEPGQFWHDTGNALLKIRSMDNTAWITIVSLDETNYFASLRPTPNGYGLGLSNDMTTPNSVVDIAVGGAIDSAASYFMKLATAFKKSFASTWVAGSGNGGLDTGTLQPSAGYNVHLIFNPTTRAVDAVGSLSYSAPGLTSGYTAFIPIGGFRTDANGHIILFAQNGDDFLYQTPIQDLAVNPSVTTAQTLALSVPTGPKVDAHCLVNMNTTASSNVTALVTSLDQADIAPSTTLNTVWVDAAEGGSTAGESDEIWVRTNTSGQVRYRSGISGGSATGLNIWTLGFRYPRFLR